MIRDIISQTKSQKSLPTTSKPLLIWSPGLLIGQWRNSPFVAVAANLPFGQTETRPRLERGRTGRPPAHCSHPTTELYFHGPHC